MPLHKHEIWLSTIALVKGTGSICLCVFCFVFDCDGWLLFSWVLLQTRNNSWIGRIILWIHDIIDHVMCNQLLSLKGQSMWNIKIRVEKYQNPRTKSKWQFKQVTVLKFMKPAHDDEQDNVDAAAQENEFNLSLHCACCCVTF